MKFGCFFFEEKNDMTASLDFNKHHENELFIL
jgi:hypothetical protein